MSGSAMKRAPEWRTRFRIFNRPRAFRFALLAVGLVANAPFAQPASAQSRVNHSAYDALLSRHVVNGLVDYDAFAKAPTFAPYLASLDRVRPEALDEDERLAFWINVYNAFTIQLIVSHGETESIRNINKTLGVLRLKGPWSAEIVRAAGQQLSLDEVQHRILRKEFGEPRVHFTLACGAKGCPPLRSEAYTGEKLVDQLNDQGRRFLREAPEINRLENKRLFYISPILWSYRDDFGPSVQDFRRSLSQWFEGEDRVLLEKGPVFVRPTPFDWSLNSQTRVAKGGAR